MGLTPHFTCTDSFARSLYTKSTESNLKEEQIKSVE